MPPPAAVAAAARLGVQLPQYLGPEGRSRQQRQAGAVPCSEISAALQHSRLTGTPRPAPPLCHPRLQDMGFSLFD